MIENVIQDVGGIGIYGIISICLFFLVFGVALVRTLRMKKDHIKNMSALPLDDQLIRTPRKGEAHDE
jgi:hypothetical protein